MARAGRPEGGLHPGPLRRHRQAKAGRQRRRGRVSPPPHPGLAHEESLTAGVGENGGLQALDGPTFIASARLGLDPQRPRPATPACWQDVVLVSTGPVRIGDSQVVTTLPKADNSVADVEITVPVENPTGAPVQATVRAAFNDVAVEKTLTLAPGWARWCSNQSISRSCRSRTPSSGGPTATASASSTACASWPMSTARSATRRTAASACAR